MPELRQRPRRSPATQLGCGLLMLMLFASTAACTGAVNLVHLLLHPGTLIFATTLATLCTVPYAVLLTRIDRHEPEPVLYLLIAFAWGAIGSIGLSGTANTLFHLSVDSAGIANAGTLTAVVSAPLVEELTKGMGLVALYVLAKDEIDNIVDGILYGGMVGLGFAWAENIHYYVGVADQGAVGMMGLTWVRGVVHGLVGHATFTGLTGAGMGMFRVGRRGVLRWLAPLGGLTLAIAAHALWNLAAPAFMAAFDDVATQLVVGLPLAILLFSIPFALMLGVTLLIAWRREEIIIRRYLSEEHCVQPDDLAALLPARRRAFTALRTIRTHGWRAARIRRRRNHALVELAFARWHHAQDPGCDWHPDEDAEIARWRETLQS